MYKEIVNIVRGISGTEYLYFDRPLEVKMSPHDHMRFYFYGVVIDPRDSIYIMDGSQEWYLVEDKEDAIVQSLYQRVKLIEQTYKISA